MSLSDQCRLCSCNFKVKFGNLSQTSYISTENLFNPSQRKDCKGQVLAQICQKVGLEVVKCEKYSSRVCNPSFCRILFVLLLINFNSWVLSIILFLTLFEWSFCYCFLLAGTTQYQLTQTHQSSTQQQLQQQGQTVSQALSNYVYDPSSGFYYDPSTGLYYDAKTQVIILMMIIRNLCVKWGRNYDHEIMKPKFWVVAIGRSLW